MKTLDKQLTYIAICTDVQQEQGTGSSKWNDVSYDSVLYQFNLMEITVLYHYIAGTRVCEASSEPVGEATVRIRKQSSRTVPGLLAWG